ncbi:hypothetical protein I551_8791 [Mycobacterium ulcerans str. Harvey]|uniref:Uncharacterized protein n=1 Tax=Mycobacterium ulcerans str. Harvey TaxID=1299332 RepID=A0ABN0R9T9_MYCUL|nr:hypothetical protein I551_8791 [Mycobacterium ulcerans str. Harvey]
MCSALHLFRTATLSTTSRWRTQLPDSNEEARMLALTN